jgi:transposase
MAFVKTDKKSSGTYIRIVESYRSDDGPPKQRTLYHLGRVEDYTPEMLQRIGARLIELGGGDLRSLIGDDIEELGRYNYGFHYIYQSLYQGYGLDRVLGRIVRRKKLGYDLSNAVLLMLLERLNDPGSKLANYENQAEYLGIEPVGLHHLYRALDQLADHHEHIQDCIYQSGRNLFNQQLDVVFFDVTTFYFDSDKVHEGSLRQIGFSKDGKLGKTQILFGLLIDKNKQPIGYQLYRGDHFEGHSFVDALDRLKKRYQIDKIIIVADRGMLNTENLSQTVDRGYHFIVGEKLKQLPKAVREPLLDLNSYQKEWIMKESAEEQIRIRYRSIEYKGRTIIATYSEKRAKKDAQEREEKLEKAQALLKEPSKLKAKARRHFITTENGKATLNEKRIKEAKRYDGILAISTNEKNLPLEQILDHYRNLYKIEQSFRSFKSHLETRPMFHWTDKRIQGHMCLCYIAYALLSQLQLKLQKKSFPLSEARLRKLINKMQMSHIRNGKREFYLRAKLCQQSLELLNKVGKKPIPSIIPKDLIIKYL